MRAHQKYLEDNAAQATLILVITIITPAMNRAGPDLMAIDLNPTDPAGRIRQRILSAIVQDENCAEGSVNYSSTM